MLKKKIQNLVKKSIRNLQEKGVFPKFKIPEILIWTPKQEEFGDYTTNIAIATAKEMKKEPVKIAQVLRDEIIKANKKVFAKIDVLNGFINFFISDQYLQKQIKEILKKKEKFGELKIGKGEKVNVEFISANPTGPLTIGNLRGGFFGDVLANVLEKSGYKVTREYYINDTGEQIKKLGHSVLNDSFAVYKGEYILDLRKRLLKDKSKKLSPEVIGKKASKIILKEMIKPVVEKEMKVKIDVWFSEESLYKSGQVKEVLKILERKNLVYEKENALFFKSSAFGDDKDRVLIKKDKSPTYFLSDLAYLRNKIKRGFKKLIFIWGADHAGYIARIKAGAVVFGLKPEQVKVIIYQLVSLLRNGKQVRMSKRKGIFVTCKELIDEVGLDSARFFFLTKSANTHLVFDLENAKKKAKENPIFYIQYANARICSILRKINPKAKNRIEEGVKKLNLLSHPKELALIKHLLKFPEVIEECSKDFQVHRICEYTFELADKFHKFYESCKVISKDDDLTQARLALLFATKIILKNSLNLMGISAPSKM